MPDDIETVKLRSIEEYPTIYSHIIEQWKEEGEDAFWLIYAANYLFRWGGVRWAVDPITMSARTSAKNPVYPESDFNRADFIILTHRHADHLDKKLIKSIAHLNIPWIIPEFLLGELEDLISKRNSRIIIPKAGEQINLSGISILPYIGNHWENTGGQSETDMQHGVPSFSYLFSANQKRWFLPGDTRTYEIMNLPDTGKLDGLIAHLWLGRKSALKTVPPLQDSFCGYFLAFNTQRIVISHLHEWGREAEDLWMEKHADAVVDTMRVLNPAILFEIALTGQKVEI